ncbi:MAG: preprotein translocase subunit SecG [Lachnospiraceae bacterium]|nr:preprotein translocase subunit SecG [Lachnospiraceae bacterium]
MRIALMVVYILICIALVVLVLMQEGKSAGLGAISGAAETYWGKNKGRSMEGTLVLATKVLAVLFIVLAMLLGMNII